jgi:hypothetical protein
MAAKLNDPGIMAVDTAREIALKSNGGRIAEKLAEKGGSQWQYPAFSVSLLLGGILSHIKSG